MSKVKYQGESITFSLSRVPVDGELTDVVAEHVVTVWSVPLSVRKLCEAIGAARGEEADQALARVLRGNYEYVRRELTRQGSNELVDQIADAVMVTDPAVYELRLRAFANESEQPITAASYVLDAALEPWGWFIGNQVFRETSHGGAVQIIHTVPRTQAEFEQALEPWFKQLDTPEAIDALHAAVLAAGQLDGATCRRMCEVAARGVQKRAGLADTEPPDAETEPAEDDDDAR